jgi:hypothetical protein
MTLAVGAVGCGGERKDVPPTTDQDAIKKERERLKSSPDYDPKVNKGK